MSAAIPPSPAPPPRRLPRARWADVLLLALPAWGVWGVFLYAYWPGVLTPDSFDQWGQAHNLALLTDWHPLTDTLLIHLLTRVWDSPAVVILFQIFVLGLVWGAVLAGFAAPGRLNPRGVARAKLLGFSLAFALLPATAILSVTLWKDVLYAAANLLLVGLLGWVWASNGAWLERPLARVGLGLAVGLPFLLRHNGLLIALAVPPALLGCYPRRWRAVLGMSVTALALILAMRQGLGFGLLHAQPNPQANLYVVPIQHISAVVHGGGQLTADQQAVLERIAPLAIWKNSYMPYSADAISKPWGATHDPQVGEKIAANSVDLLRVFVELSLRYPKVVLRSQLALTSLLWQVTTPPGYREAALDYVLLSYDAGPNPEVARLAQPRAGSALKRALDGYIQASATPGLAYDLLWRGAPYLVGMLLLAVWFVLRNQPRALLLCLPGAVNLLSLAISMPGENFRFVFPVALATWGVLPFALWGRPWRPTFADLAGWGRAAGRTLAEFWLAARELLRA